MTIKRSNPLGWFSGDSITPAQANAMDINITNGLDKRDGYSDTLASDITVAAGAGITFATSSGLTIDPSTVYIYGNHGNTSLAIGPELIGDNSQSDPLRFGILTVNISDIPVTSTGVAATRNSIAVPTVRTFNINQCNKFIIKLTGTLDATNTYLLLPVIAGYSKLIDCSAVMANNNSLSIGTKFLTLSSPISFLGTGAGPLISFSENGVTLIPENTGDDRAPFTSDGYISNRYNKAMVYSDGSFLKLGSRTNANNMIRQQHLNYPNTQGINVFTTSSTSYTDVNDGYNTYSFQFDNVQLGDYFDVTYSADIAGITSTTTADIVVQVSVGGGSFTLNSSQVTNPNSTIIQAFRNMIYKYANSGSVSVVFSLQIKSSTGSNVKVYSPLTFTVRQIRNNI